MPLRMLAEGLIVELHPLSELPHPIIRKAASSFGADPRDDNFVGCIASATVLRLLEIKQSQWRGGVWEDPSTGVCWLVVAGLAKGNHQDHDDFYQRVGSENSSGDLSHWLPSEADIRLLTQETAARLRTQWELDVQASVLGALRIIESGGRRRIDVSHPVPGRGSLAIVDVSITPVRDPDYEADEILVEVRPARPEYAGSALLWQLTLRALISIDPPEQGWDRFGDSYSNIGEPGAWATRVLSLAELVERNELATSQPGLNSHYAHREHLAGQTINGEAVRALCGIYFVPTQDHESLPRCPLCQERFDELSP